MSSSILRRSQNCNIAIATPSSSDNNGSVIPSTTLSPERRSRSLFKGIPDLRIPEEELNKLQISSSGALKPPKINAIASVPKFKIKKDSKKLTEIHLKKNIDCNDDDEDDVHDPDRMTGYEKLHVSRKVSITDELFNVATNYPSNQQNPFENNGVPTSNSDKVLLSSSSSPMLSSRNMLTNRSRGNSSVPDLDMSKIMNIIPAKQVNGSTSPPKFLRMAMDVEKVDEIHQDEQLRMKKSLESNVARLRQYKMGVNHFQKFHIFQENCKNSSSGSPGKAKLATQNRSVSKTAPVTQDEMEEDVGDNIDEDIDDQNGDGNPHVMEDEIDDEAPVDVVKTAQKSTMRLGSPPSNSVSNLSSYAMAQAASSWHSKKKEIRKKEAENKKRSMMMNKKKLKPTDDDIVIQPGTLEDIQKRGMKYQVIDPMPQSSQVGHGGSKKGKPMYEPSKFRQPEIYSEEFPPSFQEGNGDEDSLFAHLKSPTSQPPFHGVDGNSVMSAVSMEEDMEESDSVRDSSQPATTTTITNNNSNSNSNNTQTTMRTGNEGTHPTSHRNNASQKIHHEHAHFSRSIQNLSLEETGGTSTRCHSCLQTEASLWCNQCQAAFCVPCWNHVRHHEPVDPGHSDGHSVSSSNAWNKNPSKNAAALAIAMNATEDGSSHHSGLSQSSSKPSLLPSLPSFQAAPTLSTTASSTSLSFHSSNPLNRGIDLSNLPVRKITTKVVRYKEVPFDPVLLDGRGCIHEIPTTTFPSGVLDASYQQELEDLEAGTQDVASQASNLLSRVGGIMAIPAFRKGTAPSTASTAPGSRGGTSSEIWGAALNKAPSGTGNSLFWLGVLGRPDSKIGSSHPSAAAQANHHETVPEKMVESTLQTLHYHSSAKSLRELKKHRKEELRLRKKRQLQASRVPTSPSGKHGSEGSSGGPNADPGGEEGDLGADVTAVVVDDEEEDDDGIVGGEEEDEEEEEGRLLSRSMREIQWKQKHLNDMKKSRANLPGEALRLEIARKRRRKRKRVKVPPPTIPQQMIGGGSSGADGIGCQLGRTFYRYSKDLQPLSLSYSMLELPERRSMSSREVEEVEKEGKEDWKGEPKSMKVINGKVVHVLGMAKDEEGIAGKDTAGDGNAGNLQKPGSRPRSSTGNGNQNSSSATPSTAAMAATGSHAQGHGKYSWPDPSNIPRETVHIPNHPYGDAEDTSSTAGSGVGYPSLSPLPLARPPSISVSRDNVIVQAYTKQVVTGI